VTLIAQLADLQADLVAAHEAEKAAEYRVEREYEVTVDATADLTAYRDDVLYKRRDPDTDYQHRLTRELFERCEAQGLVIETHGPGAGHLIVRDPAIKEAARAALDARQAARHAITNFEAKNRDALARERDRAETDAFKKALDDGDIDSVRKTLAGHDGREPGVRKRVTTGMSS